MIFAVFDPWLLTQQINCSFYHFRNYASYFLKVTNLTHSTYICLVGVIPFEFCRDFWRQKTIIPVLSCDIICVILRLAVLIQYRSVTDTHSDRHPTKIGKTTQIVEIWRISYIRISLLFLFPVKYGKLSTAGVNRARQ